VFEFFIHLGRALMFCGGQKSLICFPIWWVNILDFANLPPPPQVLLGGSGGSVFHKKKNPNTILIFKMTGFPLGALEFFAVGFLDRLRCFFL